MPLYCSSFVGVGGFVVCRCLVRLLSLLSCRLLSLCCSLVAVVVRSKPFNVVPNLIFKVVRKMIKTVICFSAVF